MKRLLLLMACAAAAACSADWRDTSLPPQKRAELLTAEMTLDEKIGQLTSPYGWEMYERHGDSVRLTDAFREAVQNGHIGMLWGTFRADPWTQKDRATGSKYDANANVENKNIATLIGELPKSNFIRLNRRLLTDRLKDMYGKELSDRYLELLNHHFIYKNDETNLANYCASITMYP